MYNIFIIRGTCCHYSSYKKHVFWGTHFILWSTKRGSFCITIIAILKEKKHNMYVCIFINLVCCQIFEFKPQIFLFKNLSTNICKIFQNDIAIVCFLRGFGAFPRCSEVMSEYTAREHVLGTHMMLSFSPPSLLLRGWYWWACGCLRCSHHCNSIYV